MSDDDEKKHEGGGELHRGPDRTSPYPVSRLGAPVNLVDVARQIEKADQMVNTRVSSKLKVIADQIRSLQEEARQILDSAQQDHELHRAECHFKRQPGKIYHLYKRDNGSRYFSMLSPEDWKGHPPHEHIGSYRLEADMSWTPLDEIGEPDESEALVRRVLEDQGLR